MHAGINILSIFFNRGRITVKVRLFELSAGKAQATEKRSYLPEIAEIEKDMIPKNITHSNEKSLEVQALGEKFKYYFIFFERPPIVNDAAPPWTSVFIQEGLYDSFENKYTFHIL